MLPLSHIGIGLAISKPFRRDFALPHWALALGAVLPDVLDKPLYYGLSLLTGLKGADLGLISSTRTFGHTGLLCLLLLAAAFLVKRPTLKLVLYALALGDSTHLFLDELGDSLRPIAELNIQNQVSALFFPFQGFRFPVLPFATMASHSKNAFSPNMLFLELLGAALLIWEFYGKKIKGSGPFS